MFGDDMLVFGLATSVDEMRALTCDRNRAGVSPKLVMLCQR